MARRFPIPSWLLELSLAAAATLLGLFFFQYPLSEEQREPLMVAVESVAGVLCFIGLVLFRRRRPVLLTLMMIPFGILLAMPMGATPFALFAVGVYRPARITISLAALHAAAVAIIYYLVLGLTPLYYESVVFLVLLHVSFMAVAMLIRSHRQLVSSWAERARQAEDGQRLRIEQARLAERERIACEMHDVLAHRVSLLAVHAGALEVRRDAPPAEREAAAVIRQCAHDALEDLRTLLGMVRTPTDNHPQPTLGDVPALVEQSRSTGTEIGLSVAGDGPDGGDTVPAPLGRHAYRIVQEALTNARKHAPGAPVRVNIDVRTGQGLTVQIDNALVHAAAGRIPEVAPLPGAGAGLAGLRERIRLLGGRLEHGPTAGGNFHLQAWLPWPS
jgi:signal transduction histidine kinase